MKPLSKQASMSALWGALFAVAMVLGADFLNPGINAAVAHATVRAASQSVSSQMAAVGSVVERHTIYKVHVDTERGEKAHLKKGEIKKAHMHKRTYIFASPASFESFYNSDVGRALEIIERGKGVRGP